MRSATSSPVAGKMGTAGDASGAPRATAILDEWAAPAIAGLLVGLLAADQGGYFPTAWGWGALGALWAVGIWLVVGARTEARGVEGVLIGGFGLFGIWTAVSILWSDSPALSVLATERTLLYLSAIAAVLVLVRRQSLQRLVGAVLAATALVALYSLCTRLFPDRLGSYDPVTPYRLADPVGYWNGLGVLAAFGVLLALGFAARGRTTAVRISSAAALIIFVPTLYFTFSRGAWVALGVGLLCAFAYDARRLQLASTTLLIAPAPAIATLLASRSHGWTATDVIFARAVHDGHRLALALLIVALVAAACAFLQVVLERRIRPSSAARRTCGILLVAIPAAAVILIVGHYGGPSKVVSRSYEAFKTPPAESANPNTRVLLSSDGRLDLWRVAWRQQYLNHRALGSGAGTFSRYWFRHRPVNFDSKEGFSIYLETLAELGPVGLVLLVICLVLPLWAAVFARGEPLAAVVFAAYVAFLFHAGLDWDYELPAVGLAGLFCGLSLLVAARPRSGRRVLAKLAWAGSLTVVVALAGFALFGLIGNSALAASESARGDRNWVKAETQARKAHRLMPWSPEPWAALGKAQYAAGDVRGARTSFRRAIAQDSGDWTLWLDLATVTKGPERQHAIESGRRLNPFSYYWGPSP